MRFKKFVLSCTALLNDVNSLDTVIRLLLCISGFCCRGPLIASRISLPKAVTPTMRSAVFHFSNQQLVISIARIRKVLLTQSVVLDD